MLGGDDTTACWVVMILRPFCPTKTERGSSVLVSVGSSIFHLQDPGVAVLYKTFCVTSHSPMMHPLSFPSCDNDTVDRFANAACALDVDGASAVLSLRCYKNSISNAAHALTAHRRNPERANSVSIQHHDHLLQCWAQALHTLPSP